MAANWDPTSLPIRPGLYANFVNAAAAAIKGGARGIVAIPLKTYAGTATAKTFYTVEDEKQASDLFGLANIKSILFALQGGAKEVLVYTMPATPTAQDYIDMRNAFEARPFNVFVYDGEVSDDEQDATLTWVQRNRTEDGKHFMVVFGGTDETDADPALGNARTTQLADDYAVNLITGVTINGTDYNSSEFAPWVAGKIAGTAINKSITYQVAPVDDVTKRLRNSEIKTALQAGSLVLVHDGEKVKIEQALVTSKNKIRIMRARQAILTDIAKTASEAYIGKLDNNDDGRAMLIAAIKLYLEQLEVNNVLQKPIVTVDPLRPPVGDSVFLSISYIETDSMERIFLEITV
jgi:hypothetical protein